MTKQIAYAAFTCLIASWGVISPTVAAPIHANMTCSDFISLTDVQRPKIVYWAEGAKHKAVPREAVIDVASVDQVVPMIVEQCTAAPQASFWTRLEASWKDFEASVKRNRL